MTPLLFSVSYAGLWGQHALDLPAFLIRAAKLGYEAVMLADGQGSPAPRVPEPHGGIPPGGGQRPAIWREGQRQDALGVTAEGPLQPATHRIPEAECESL